MAQKYTEETRKAIVEDALDHDKTLDEVAKKHGCSRSTVQRFLRESGKKRLTVSERWDYFWEEVDPLIGTMPDTHLAEKFNVAQSTISERRRKLEMPNYSNPEIPTENEERQDLLDTWKVPPDVLNNLLYWKRWKLIRRVL